MRKYVQPFTRAAALSSLPAYRAITLLFIIVLSSDEVANKYAEIILLGSFITSFSGTAVSTQIYIPHRSLSWITLVAYTVGLTSICIAVIVSIDFVEDLDPLILFSTSFFMSLFEILKAESLVAGRFRRILVAGILSTLALPLGFLMLGESFAYLAVFIFLMPVIFMLPVSRRPSFSLNEFDYIVSADVISYSLSNSFSTGMAFLIPILLLQELDANAAQYFVIVTTLASIFYLYPRFLSAALLIKFQSKIHESDVKTAELKIFYGFLCASIFFLFPLYYLQFGPVMTIFVVSLLLSQVAVPCANVLNVMGRGKQLLSINIVAILLLIIGCLIAYYVSTAGAFRAMLYASCFGLSTLIRVLITMSVARHAMSHMYSQ